MQPSSEAPTEATELNPVDASMEAALELEEMKQGRRADAPALQYLIDLLRKPSVGFAGEGISMLADMRSFTMFKEFLGQVAPKVQAANSSQLPKVIDNFLSDLQNGVSAGNSEKITLAKRFCLVFNNSLLAKHMSDIYARREHSDARYISHDHLP